MAVQLQLRSLPFLSTPCPPSLHTAQICSLAPQCSKRSIVRAIGTSMSNKISETNSSDIFTSSKKSGTLHFFKYHGLGNDFILVDNRDSLQPMITQEQAVKLCDRNFGIGADGLIFALPGINGTDYSMRIFNSDGSEPEMCGNGVRCFARFVAELENLRGMQRFTIHTGAGLIVPEVREDGQVRVDMGEPVLNPLEVPTKLPPNEDGIVVKAELVIDDVTWNVTCVSMGNPHCVTFGTKESQELLVDELKLSKIGPRFENHDMFPSRTNTGATLACGTGACATVVAAVLEGHSSRNCKVVLPGGPLEIEWNEQNNRVYMTGPAELVFCGYVIDEIQDWASFTGTINSISASFKAIGRLYGAESPKNRIRKASFTTTVYHIWRERNRRLYQKKSQNAEALVRKIKSKFT